MEGSRIPVAVAHGEGYADFSQQGDIDRVAVAMRFVDHRGEATERYPFNPNGSPAGITSVTTADGRFSVLMPHMERVHRTVAMSWHPESWGEAAVDARVPQRALDRLIGMMFDPHAPVEVVTLRDERASEADAIGRVVAAFAGEPEGGQFERRIVDTLRADGV